MTEFKIGDIVRMSKGEPDTPGYEAWVRVVTSNDLTAKEISLGVLRSFEDVGWTVELVERSAPSLPTKPNALGWATWDGKRCIVRRNVLESWDAYDYSGMRYMVSSESLSDFTEAALIPKKLADEITEWADDEGGKWLASVILQQIADHLKGQDDE